MYNITHSSCIQIICMDKYIHIYIYIRIRLYAYIHTFILCMCTYIFIHWCLITFLSDLQNARRHLSAFKAASKHTTTCIPNSSCTKSSNTSGEHTEKSAISVLMSHTYLSICSANISLGTQAKTCFETKTKRERTEKIALSTLMSHTYLSICSL